MKALVTVQKFDHALAPWAKKADCVGWGPFCITNVQQWESKFGLQVVFTLTHLSTGEMRAISLSPTGIRAQFLDYFQTEDAEPVGPCMLEMGTKAWMFVEPKAAAAAVKEEQIPF